MRSKVLAAGQVLAAGHCCLLLWSFAHVYAFGSYIYLGFQLCSLWQLCAAAWFYGWFNRQILFFTILLLFYFVFCCGGHSKQLKTVQRGCSNHIHSVQHTHHAINLNWYSEWPKQSINPSVPCDVCCVCEPQAFDTNYLGWRNIRDFQNCFHQERMHSANILH